MTGNTSNEAIPAGVGVFLEHSMDRTLDTSLDGGRKWRLNDAAAVGERPAF